MSRVRVDALGDATSLADRKRRAGQRLAIGWPSDHVTDDLRRLVREIQPAMFVLLARNVTEVDQVREVARELRSLARPADPVLVAIDHEGGRVQRIREPATVWPPFAALGGVDDLALTRDVGRAMGRELRAVDIDVMLGPVADLSTSPAIGDRGLGEDPDRVAAHVGAFVRGAQRAGVVACAKHFPGLGHAALDPHRALPVVDVDLPELERVALPPFAAAIDAGVAMVMTGHVVVQAWDEAQPATLSSRVVPRVLRAQLGFHGVVVSDDVEMGALRAYPPSELSRRAAEAVDVVMVADTLELQHAVFRELVLDQEEHVAQEQRAIDAVGRVVALRERFLLGRPAARPDLLGSPEHRRLADLMRARGL